MGKLISEIVFDFNYNFLPRSIFVTVVTANKHTTTRRIFNLVKTIYIFGVAY